MVIVGGSNVFCPEVEQVIMLNEQVADTAVIGLPLPDEGEELVACIVLREGGSLDLEQLWQHCEHKLARHKWPTKVFYLQSIPRTAVDKIDKKILRSQLSINNMN